MSMILTRLLLIVFLAQLKQNRAVNSGQQSNFDHHSSFLPDLKVIAAGHGTTGTHSIYQELCKMEYSAIHYGQECGLLLQKQVVLKEYLESTQHLKNRKTNTHLPSKSSAELPAFNNSVEVLDVEATIERLLAILKQGKVDVVVDTPVAFMFDELYQSASPGVKVVLSTRDPLEWATRRMKEHHTELICAESALWFNRSNEDNNYNLSESILAKHVGLPPLPHPFALRSCAKRAMIRAALVGNHKDPYFSPFYSPFTSLSSYNEMVSSRLHENVGKQPLVDAYVQYNQYVRSVVPPDQLLEVDLWEDDPCDFHLRIESFLGRKLAGDYHSDFVGIKIGGEIHRPGASIEKVLTTKCPV